MSLAENKGVVAKNRVSRAKYSQERPENYWRKTWFAPVLAAKQR